MRDAGAGLYDALHLNFCAPLPRNLLEELAAAAVAAGCLPRIAKPLTSLSRSDSLARFLSLSLPPLTPLADDDADRPAAHRKGTQGAGPAYARTAAHKKTTPARMGSNQYAGRNTSIAGGLTQQAKQIV